MIDVTAHGAVDDNLTDTGPALRSAIAAAEALVVANNGAPIIYFPHVTLGKYRFKTGATITKSGIMLQGENWDVRLVFDPDVDDLVLLNFDIGGTGPLSYVGVSELRMVSTNAQRCTALRTKDVAEPRFENLLIGPWTGGSVGGTGGSTGWEIRGREAYKADTVHIDADRPIRIMQNDQAAGKGLDHSWLMNMRLIVSSGLTNPNIEIEDGLQINNLVLDNHSWNKGGDGLRWVDSTSTALSRGITLRNVRSEQGTDANAWTVLIDKTDGSLLTNLVISDSVLGLSRQGIKLRNVKRLRCKSVTYGGSGAGLDMDDAESFQHEAFAVATTATVATGNLVQQMSGGRMFSANSPIQETGWWAGPASPAEQPLRIHGAKVFALKVTMVNNAIVSLAAMGDGQARVLSRLEIVAIDTLSRDLVHAEVVDYVGGPSVLRSSARFSVGANVPDSLNYINNGTNARLQNKLGVPVSLLVNGWAM